MQTAKDRLIVALDVDSREEALAIVQAVGKNCGTFKIGMQLHNSVGFAITEEIIALGYPVFLDLKFHDIPNTVAKASAVVTGKSVSMFTLHASGGKSMMARAAEEAKQKASTMNKDIPLVLAVTILTSMNQKTLNEEVGMDGSVEHNVLRLAKVAEEAGVGGVVASPQEISLIRQACSENFKIVTPGVRPLWADANDQARTMTPEEAMTAGADYLVVGRPITASANPAESAQKIIEEMEKGLQQRQLR
ncbi:orotidine-5'-phosphate decarboxylase [Heliorestis acidaminivorans]|uniref:Orotidine 5'-phosphate decarboxylase n=1 Tax=Heliorestis acidaminivorans TaxID=553427 RepID=A0A6I0EZH9_9FIRM|nr:orotidine-5'-phosphate decarboxylase [Heliorestis acidaminivorans]KAB2951299.1 orotidine-5'-phosphate decarboxylase [Heliorestis acidaminivorans]